MSTTTKPYAFGSITADEIRRSAVINTVISAVVCIASFVIAAYHWVHRFGWFGATVPDDATAQSYSLWAAVVSTGVTVFSGWIVWDQAYIWSDINREVKVRKTTPQVTGSWSG